MDHRIMLELTGETKRAIAKHGHDGVKDRSWMRAGLILSEEAGEVSKAILETFDDMGSWKVPPRIGLTRIYDEAKETASVAVRIMERCRETAAKIEQAQREEEEANAKAKASNSGTGSAVGK